MFKRLFWILSPIGLTWLIFITLVICSAAVTAYYGKMMAGEFTLVAGFDFLLWTIPDLTMGLFTASGFFAISVASAIFAYHGGVMRATGAPEAKLVLQFAVLLLCADIFTNYMSWSTIRSGKAVIAGEQNRKAGNIQARIDALAKAEAGHTETINQAGSWIDSKTAQNLLDSTVAARDREGARVKCGDKCEALDREARGIAKQLTKAKAVEKAIALRAKIRAQIAVLKQQAEAETGKKVVDATAAQNRELASAFAGMAPNEKAVFLASKVIGFVGALMFSLCATACGILLGILTGRRRAYAEAYETPSEPPEAPRPRFIAANPEFTPQPVPEAPQPLTTTSTVINYTGSGKIDRRAIDQLMDTLDAEFGLKPTNQT